MDHKTLATELKKKFPEIDVKEGENNTIEIADFYLQGFRITINHSVVLRCQSISLLEPALFITYLETHLDSESIESIINKDGIHFYPGKTYGTDAKGRIERRMYVLMLLTRVKAVIHRLEAEIINKKLN